MFQSRNKVFQSEGEGLLGILAALPFTLKRVGIDCMDGHLAMSVGALGHQEENYFITVR